MELHEVTSSVLSAIGYDRERRVLEVRFRTGRVYHYFEVPQKMVKQLLDARSKGRFFNVAIRPYFRCELVYDPRRRGRQ
jgi:hypothetical protein